MKNLAWDNREGIAKKIVSNEITNLSINPETIQQNECAACHILFRLVNIMHVTEENASDILSEILYRDSNLNDLFIEMVENIHMKQRDMGGLFPVKSRDAKDRYIDSNIKTTLVELSSDLINYGSDIVLRKLLISTIALGIAQNIGIDYHAATEELYYYMRKNDKRTHESVQAFIDNLHKGIGRGA